MKVGFLTSVLGGMEFEKLVHWAGEVGFDCLEVATGRHMNPGKALSGNVGAIKALLAANNIEISSLACYDNLLEADPEKRQKKLDYFKDVVRLCSELSVPVACTMAGFPVPGKNKFKTLSEDFADVFGPLVDWAETMGVKIAMENWTATNIQGLAHWDKAFEAVPSKNLGLNFDPSHLYWQSIDYLAAVDKYADRIFHTHAKDCIIKDAVLKHVGVLGDGWWRFCIPGFGGIDWPRYIQYLRAIGYDGALSIEHEDDMLSPEEGLIKGYNYLKTWAIGR